jgi:peptide deformylase
MQEKFSYLKKCMRDFRRITKGKGRGIAAVQVGIPQRFFLLYQAEAKNPYVIIINPVITKKAEELYSYPESCMSANSLIANVTRPAWIEFSYVDELGKKRLWQMKANTQQEKMGNRIVQHEIDHLDGIINIDYVPSHSLIFESGKEYYGKAPFRKVQ